MQGTPPQLSSIVVRAGAGAGKTTRLVDQVVSLADAFFEKTGRAPRVLVTTFTKKATQELRERMIRKACERAREDLLEFVSSSSLLHISTIHGVLGLFLRRYGHLAGLDSGFKIMDSVAAEQILKKVLKENILGHPELASLLDVFSVRELLRILNDLDEWNRANPNASPYGERELRACLENTRRCVLNEGIELLNRIRNESEKENWRQYAGQALEILHGAQEREYSLSQIYEALESLERPRYSKNAFASDLNEEFKEWRESFDELCENPAAHEANLKFSADILDKIARCYRRTSEVFLKKKLESGLFEMRDLELVTMDILRKEPELGHAFAKDWDYGLIDEYQDTSPLQVEILKTLLKDLPLYIVGDPQQSIYLFRGARSEVFAQAEERTTRAGGRLELLDKNYRSTPELLMFINELTQQLGPEFSAMRPREEAFDPKCVVAVFAPNDEKGEELKPIADFILSEGGRYDDFGILARRNSDLVKIAGYLESLGIPTHIHMSGGFSDQREVLDAIFILRFLANPHDYENTVGLLRSPWFRVEDAVLADWARRLKNKDWLELCAIAGDHPVILNLQRLLADTVQLGIFETFRRTLCDCGLIESSYSFDSTGRREANIWKLLMSLRQAERSPHFNYISFTEQLLSGVQSDEDESEAVAAIEPNRVNLMTVHKAKGLKFKKVILPNLHKRPQTQILRPHEKMVVFDEDKKMWSVRMPLGPEDKKVHLLPARETLEKISERERAESKRLFYVAVTRAEEKCFFTWSGKIENEAWASYLRFDLTPGIHKEKYFSYEVKTPPWSETVVAPNSAPSRVIRELWSRDVNHSPARLSVSSLLNTMEAPAKSSSWQPKFTHESLEKTLMAPAVGIKIHSLLERLRYHPDVNFEEEILEWFGSSADSFRKAFDYVRNLSCPDMRTLLTEGFVEWGFQAKTARGLLEGQIDLWGRVKGEVWVVDYKSGSDRFKERAFQQLELYAYALWLAGEKGPFQLAVIYPLAQKVDIRVAREPSEIGRQYGLTS